MWVTILASIKSGIKIPILIGISIFIPCLPPPCGITDTASYGSTAPILCGSPSSHLSHGAQKRTHRPPTQNDQTSKSGKRRKRRETQSVLAPATREGGPPRLPRAHCLPTPKEQERKTRKSRDKQIFLAPATQERSPPWRESASPWRESEIEPLCLQERGLTPGWGSGSGKRGEA